MTVTRKLWAPAILGLLVATLLGIPASDDQAAAAPEPQFVGKIMIPAASFIPVEDDIDYTNRGAYLYVVGNPGTFTAPLSFPLPVVNIRRITLYAYDNTSSVGVCVTLYRTSPAAPKKASMGEACTDNSVADPQVVTTTAINPREVNTAFHGPYLELYIDPSTRFYGVAVTYSYHV